MEDRIREIVLNALTAAKEAGDLTYQSLPEVTLSRPQDKTHGDVTSTIALELSSQERRPPREIAQRIVKYFDTEHSPIQEYHIAGPGFINFFLNHSYWYNELKAIVEAGERFGEINIGDGMKVQVEFVSTNPTGPLHIGHGRNAIVGDVTARILALAGYDVQREYYVNDAGTQIEKLGHSTWCRYMELSGKPVEFIEDGYHGQYIYDIAGEILEQEGDKYVEMPFETALPEFQRYACQRMLEWIKVDLERFQITFDNWFSEQRLYATDEFQKTIARLKSEGVLYEEDDALWFQASGHEDEKDRVVIRSDGRPTYFASDIAYHENKFQRGFQKVINVWGADHHGYIPRMKGVVKALGYSEDALDVILVQMVNLVRGGERISMSKRAGELITLADILDEVGVDATRFFLLMRRSDSHLDFDLDLAKSQLKENPVYYVQYAHARICSIFREAEKQGIQLPDPEEIDCAVLQEEEELALISELCQFPKVIEVSARSLEPHRITFYVQNLAAIFHPYYNKHRVISDDVKRSYARLFLMKGIQTVLQNALRVLGVSAPERM